MRQSTLDPILIIDDDPDDRLLIQEVCNDLNVENEIVWFTDGRDVISYLLKATRRPFLILCDVNMPGMSGIQVREAISADETLKRRSIPFIFLSTTASQKDVNHAYDMTVQGFFEKGHDFKKLKCRLKLIFEYWKECAHPNSFSTSRK